MGRNEYFPQTEGDKKWDAQFGGKEPDFLPPFCSLDSINPEDPPEPISRSFPQGKVVIQREDRIVGGGFLWP
jgi:hypothetical protein